MGFDMPELRLLSSAWSLSFLAKMITFAQWQRFTTIPYISHHGRSIFNETINADAILINGFSLLPHRLPSSPHSLRIWYFTFRLNSQNAVCLYLRYCCCNRDSHATHTLKRTSQSTIAKQTHPQYLNSIHSLIAFSSPCHAQRCIYA